MSDFLPHPFWNFSLELYAGEGVAEACLDLQERRGCDVTMRDDAFDVRPVVQRQQTHAIGVIQVFTPLCSKPS